MGGTVTILGKDDLNKREGEERERLRERGVAKGTRGEPDPTKKR